MSLNEEIILVIDDDPLQLEIMADDLSNLGVGTFFIADGGAKALDILIRERGRITTILTDINMPEMDGPQLLRKLADIGCSARIVLISGAKADIMHSMGRLGQSHGLQVIGFIQKPVSPEALKTLLVGHAESRKRQSAAPDQDLDLSPARLIAALKKREIHPWYQPKTGGPRLRLSGVEALARWRLPSGAMISPAEFIPPIEAAGLADELFFCIFEQVLEDTKRWRDAGMRIKASINMTIDSAYKLDLPERISTVMEKTAAAPDGLVIEITESRLMANPAAAIETLTRLSLMGIVLSIDDFGTGYSGLAQVANLPFGELKLDGSFVQQIGKSPKADAILRSTITLGRSLGMEVVAEGVETSRQLDLLRAMGADVIQGFLVARPMPASVFEQWLASWRPGRAEQPGCKRPITVLVVDDERSMRMVIQAELEKRLHGARILTAASGNEALKIAREQTIDAVTLDYHMVGLNGLETLIQMRDICPSSRQVLLTADPNEEIARNATSLGALYCLKPMSGAQADRIARHFCEP